MVSVQKLEPVTVPAPAPMARPADDVRVEAVRTPSERDAFIRFAWNVYRGDANWVPPLIMERRDFLNPRKNPLFDHAVVELFLARQNGKIVGRIAAVEDELYLKTHGTRTGYFGLFESIDDAAVAAALFETAKAWARNRGLVSIIGPLNLSINGEPGLLVDGFENPPTILTTYNPRHYPALYEACGLKKIKDLWAWVVTSEQPIPEKPARIAEKVRQKEGVVVRPVKLKDFDAEIRRIKDIYNDAWEKNWGFVPMTEREIEQMARDLKPIVVPELTMIAEVNGEPIAMSLALPDANQALKPLDGRLTTWGLPIGLFKLLGGLKKIDRLRLVALGVRSGYRRRGIDAVMTYDTMRKGIELGYKWCEISWTLEDNDLINRSIEVFGGKRTKTWRLYEVAT